MHVISGFVDETNGDGIICMTCIHAREHTTIMKRLCGQYSVISFAR